MPEYVNARIWKETRRLLRLIAAQSGEQMVQVMHRLCVEEWKRVTPPAPAARSAQRPRRPAIERRRVDKGMTMSITDQLEQLALYRADSADTAKLLDKAMKPSAARLAIRVEELIAERDRHRAALICIKHLPSNKHQPSDEAQDIARVALGET
jgi:hypothetical protein